MANRTRIQTQIEQTLAIRDAIYAQINAVEVLTDEFLAARLADIELITQCLDDLAGRLAVAK